MEIKKQPGDLALFGGEPAFSRDLFVGRPNLPGREAFLRRVNDIFDRAWVTNNGAYVQEFEQQLIQRTKTRHCIPMCNGTVAMEIAIRALNLSGEVIVPAYTFIATAHALQWQQITPVFCDVDRRTHNIDPARVEALITPRTTGIIGVHLWGRCCDVDALTAIAKRHHLKLIFDAAHAFGCTYRGQPVGGLGDAEVFSFHATKFLNTFEGGAVATNHDDAARVMRLMKNFGFVGFDKVDHVGTNGKMTEVSAAMGITQLENLETIIERNRVNYKAYQREFATIPGISLMPYDETGQNNYQYVVAEFEDDAALTRDEIMRILHAERVIARRYFYPGCQGMEPYRTLYPEAAEHLPNTRKLGDVVLILPTGTSIDEETILRIGHVIRFAMSHAGEVRDRMAVMR